MKVLVFYLPVPLIVFSFLSSLSPTEISCHEEERYLSLLATELGEDMVERERESWGERRRRERKMRERKERGKEKKKREMSDGS